MLDLTPEQLLMTTRAVRKRMDFDRPVEPEVIAECIELAIQAPTGGNAQGWRWVVVTEEDKKKALAEMYRKSWATAYGGDPGSMQQGLDGERAAQQARVYDSADFLANNLERAPVYVIPCLLGRLPEGTPGWIWASMMGSIFPAVWSFQLAARMHGLGTVLTTLHLAFENEAAELLGMPDHVQQVALLPVAYTKRTDFKPAKRRPASEITYWNSWKSFS